MPPVLAALLRSPCPVCWQTPVHGCHPPPMLSQDNANTIPLAPSRRRRLPGQSCNNSLWPVMRTYGARCLSFFPIDQHWGRGTRSGRAGGTYRLVVESGVDMAVSSGFPLMGLSRHNLPVPARSKGPTRWAGPLLEKSIYRYVDMPPRDLERTPCRHPRRTENL
jgi:hypothetical protein